MSQQSGPTFARIIELTAGVVKMTTDAEMVDYLTNKATGLLGQIMSGETVPVGSKLTAIFMPKMDSGNPNGGVVDITVKQLPDVSVNQHGDTVTKHLGLSTTVTIVGNMLMRVALGDDYKFITAQAAKQPEAVSADASGK